MKLRLAFVGAAIGALAITGCGSDGGDGGGETVNPDGTHTQYVADTITIPGSAAEATQLGLDLDGDDVVDNALGQNLSILATQGVDLQASVDEAIVTGSIVLLANVQATALDNATGVGFSVFLGEEPTSPAPCTDPEEITTCGLHLDGSGMFSVSSDSPSDALIVGSILGGSFQTSTVGNVTLRLELVEGQPAIELNLIGARAEYSASASNLMSGKLGGAITEDEARNNLLPVIVDLVIATVEEDCMGTPGDCCTPDSTGETVLTIFNTDGDCAVSEEEVETNDLVGTVLSPDVDLIGDDGVDDSISLGLGFTGVGATFTRP
jgi:hypothetical protein